MDEGRLSIGGYLDWLAPMTDPQFQTRADLEAWAKDLAGTVVTAVTLAKTGEPDHARSIWQSALAQLRRVTAAHLYLPFEEEPKK